MSTKNLNKAEKNVKEIKNVNQKDLFKDLDLDKSNLETFFKKLDSKKLDSKKETQGKRELYKKSLKDFEKDSEYKSYKRKMRNKLKSFCNNIQFHFLKKDSASLEKEINLFQSFYKENYILNDYSDESLRFNNADEDTKDNIKDTLVILKALKIK